MNSIDDLIRDVIFKLFDIKDSTRLSEHEKALSSLELLLTATRYLEVNIK